MSESSTSEPEAEPLPSPPGRWPRVIVMTMILGFCVHSLVVGMKDLSTVSDLLKYDGFEEISSYFSAKNETAKEDLVAESSNREVVDFEKQPGVVIGMKVHGFDGDVEQLKQTLCLLQYGYNNRTQYDLLIFTTIQMSEEGKQTLRDFVFPTKVIVAQDDYLERSLQEQLNDLTQEQRDVLAKRCNVNSTEEIGDEWFRRCQDGRFYMPLAYTWMSEFRSKQIWVHPALKDYKYMLWIDTDAFATQVWQKDPVATLIRNDLVLLIGNFPAGTMRGEEIHRRIKAVFNTTLCNLRIVGGQFARDLGDSCYGKGVGQVHGYMHVTNLDFYRSPIGIQWSNSLIGDGKYQRIYDDQMAVTVPAAILEPERSWDMRSHGIYLNVSHNFHFDGKEKHRGGFKNFWRQEGRERFPEAFDQCNPYVNFAGRR